MTPAFSLWLDSLALVLALLVTVPGCQATSPRAAALEWRDAEWPTYGGTHACARYSPLAQIDRDNVRQLRVAWRWRSPDHDIMARTKPPFGRLVAIDLNTGDHQWTVPLGEGPRNHPLLRPLDLPRLGWPRRGFPLVTRTLLFAAQQGQPTGSRRARDRPWVQIYSFATHEPTLEVFDKRTGELLAQIALPANANGALMTYMVRGRQYIVIPVGGANSPAELVALSLP